MPLLYIWFENAEQENLRWIWTIYIIWAIHHTHTQYARWDESAEIAGLVALTITLKIHLTPDYFWHDLHHGFRFSPPCQAQPWQRRAQAWQRRAQAWQRRAQAWQHFNTRSLRQNMISPWGFMVPQVMPLSFTPTAVVIPEVPCSGGRRKDKSDKLEVGIEWNILFYQLIN
jgi:hypothetical protein